ncbi:PDZ and LIM domain protein Zasp isoform X5 [Toxorhynchites rutilus septentrionalis]|uniref:PDZ and LIM domain protein Zasp isoform X5 n=1 Tax=Toxorhynchites rutilus septentrionalis TaxID=329112 RepID=UPI002479BB37|nr:PDZ and LIM domain protein Zasp isoform X5 [Toxorhynchites rutilus septentrionalis]
MGPKAHDFLVTLRRNSPQTPWGIRLVGGTDLNAPLIITRVQVNSPAQKELLRGDIITKIDQYDARDLTHNDAQNLFRDASNQIKVTIRRDDTVALYQSAHEKNDVGSAGYSPALSPIPPAHSAQPYKPYGQPAPAQPFQQQPQQPKAQPHLNFPPPEPSQLLPSVNSSLPHGPQAYAAALEHPVETLPHTAFPKLDASGAYQLPKTPYPPPMVPNFDEANEAITNQPYRTTPLVLPGAKVPKMDALPTESYLRHHPNPAMRAPPVHDYTDTLMRQKIVHKQFNSPIGLYSDSNIENTIRQTAPQTQAVPIFIDLSFLKQKQQILEEQRRLAQENQLKQKYPFQSYASSSSLHSSASGHSSPSPYAQQQYQQHPQQLQPQQRQGQQPTLSSPPPIPPLPGNYYQPQQHPHNY